MRLGIWIIAAAGSFATAAVALGPQGSMPDVTRQHHQRVTCHNAYDALLAAGKAGGSATSEEIAFGEAYEANAEAKTPCPAVPASLHARAANHVVTQGETVARLVQYIESNDGSAYFEAGVAAFEQAIPDVTQQDGIAFFQKAAELGDPDGHYMMARLYLGGQFGAKLDWKGAYPHLEAAAKGGHVDGIFLVGQLAYDGALGKKDRKTSFEYYKRAAERGHVYATYMAAWQAVEGEGVKKDPDLTYRLARNLADEGEAVGPVLALMALLKKADAKDQDEALYWMDAAMRGGDDKIKATVSQYRPRIESLYQRLNAPPEYRPREWKACPTKTVCLVNQYTRAQSCTTNKDYWSDCDG